MGNKSSKNAEYQRLRAKFDNKELAVLQRAFQDLAQRSSSKTIDKITFTKVFQLPGILGDRLFSAFDRKNIGAIDWEEFIGGLGLIVRGSLDEKIDFLFRMYDLNGLGYLTRAELTTMLNSVMFAAYTIVDASMDGDTLADEAVQKLNEKVQFLVASAFADLDSDRLWKEQFKQWVVEHSETLDFLDMVFQPNSAAPMPDGHSGSRSHRKRPSSTDKEKITFDGILSSNSPALSRTPSFRQHSTAPTNRLRKASSVLSNAFFKTLTGHDTMPHVHRRHTSDAIERDTTSNGMHVTCQACHYLISVRNCCRCGKPLQTTGSKIITCRDCCAQGMQWVCTHCLHCGFDLSLNDKPLEPMFGRGLAEDDDCEIEGWLYKIGSMFKKLKYRWFLIKDNFLYTFHSDKDVRPTGLLCLEGCFVEPVDHGDRNHRMKYGIEISMPTSGHNVSRFFYAKDEQAQSEWCAAFRHAARQFVLEDYYEIGPQLGTGKFSSVCGCTHKATGKKYAVKIIDKSSMSDTEREMLRTEIAVLQLIHHPNVIHLKNVFETRAKIFIITTLVEGGDLFERILVRHRFTETTARSVVRQLLMAVQYLHERGIVHRDLKPENIMMTSPDSDLDIQVGDFGLSKFAAPNESMNMPCGTLAYVAPEVLTQVGYGKEVDVWSIGVVMYVLLRGRLPFEAKNKDEMIDKTISGRLAIDGDPVWAQISDSAKDMIRKLLCPDPRRRLTVVQALNEPWLLADSKPIEGVPDPPAAPASPASSATSGPAQESSGPSTALEPEHDLPSVAEQNSDHDPVRLTVDVASSLMGNTLSSLHTLSPSASRDWSSLSPIAAEDGLSSPAIASPRSCSPASGTMQSASSVVEVGGGTSSSSSS